MLALDIPYRDKIIEAIVENPNYCIVAVDAEGYVTFLSKTYCEFLETTLEESLGKHVHRGH